MLVLIAALTLLLLLALTWAVFRLGRKTAAIHKEVQGIHTEIIRTQAPTFGRRRRTGYPEGAARS